MEVIGSRLSALLDRNPQAKDLSGAQCDASNIARAGDGAPAPMSGILCEQGDFRAVTTKWKKRSCKSTEQLCGESESEEAGKRR